MPPHHACTGPGCTKCQDMRLASLLMDKFSPPRPSGKTGDPCIDYLDEMAYVNNQGLNTFEALAEKVGSIDPVVKRLVDGAFTIHQSTSKNIVIQKDYYLGLRIAIDAEKRKPANEQNEKLLAGFRANLKALVADFEKNLLELDYLARMQAFAENDGSEVGKEISWTWSDTAPQRKQEVDAYRKEHEF